MVPAFVAALIAGSFINYSSKEINVKVVYYGPASAGLMENLQYVYDKTDPEAKGKMISLATETEKVVFFDFLPKSLGTIRGFSVRFHLYTVPNMFFDASRTLVLKGVDGVVFVADGDPAKAEATKMSWESLHGALAELGYDPKKTPIVVQIDQHGKPNAMNAGQIEKLLGLTDQPIFAATPATGAGVFDTLKGVAKLILLALKSGAS